jgi:hypothetical protein
MLQAQVLDRYGNNAAVGCGFCYRTFVVSQLLNKKNGRSCPHCAKDRVRFDEDGQIQSTREQDSSDPDTGVRRLLALVKPLAAEFYRLTGKPLGVTGEIAEFVASDILGLTLTSARTIGYDALRGSERIQIKGRAFGADAKPGQRMSRIKLDAPCDTVLLVLLDNKTLDPREIWEAPYQKVCEVLSKPGSKARERGALGVPAFKAIATKVWKCEV